MNHKPLIVLALVSSLAATAAVAPEARADVASDRVLLVAGSQFGCSTGAIGFKRLRQDPDGGSFQESIEYQVPEGSYLDITSIEYTTPYYLKWATSYVQSIDLVIRKRTASVATNIFSARYHNRATYASDNYVFDETNEYVSPGATTRVATFPAGPLMSSGGRLCLSASNNFFIYGGSVRVRGRLISSGSAVPMQPPVSTNGN